jgi:hypothetical protein
MDPRSNEKPATIDWIDVVFGVLCMLYGAFFALLIIGSIGAKPSAPPKDQGTVMFIGSKFGVQSVIPTKPN